MGLIHDDILVDADAKCVIDVESKKIECSSPKNALVQYDHNSERIGFTMPRYVDGHDMSLVDRIVIKYLNVRKNDMYIVDDLSVTEDGENITFTWLVSGNATQEVGSLVFLVNFRCYDDEGRITYNWSTKPCSTFSIMEGVTSMDSNPLELYDFWARYGEKVDNTMALADKLEEDVNSLITNTEALSGNVDTLNNDTDVLERKVDGLEQNVPTLTNRINNLNSDITPLENRVNSLERTLSDDQALVINQTLEELDIQIEDVRTELASEGKSTFFSDTYNVLDNIVDTTNLGYQLNNNTGELYAADSCSVTDFIEVEENTLYYAYSINVYNSYENFANRCVFYNKDRQYLGYVEDPSQRYFTTPVSCKYIRISQAVPTGVELHNVYVGTKDSGIRLYIKDNYTFLYDKESSFKKESYNLFDKNKITTGYRNSKTVLYGYAYDDTEALNATDGYFVSDYIPVQNGDILHIGFIDNGAFRYIASTQRVLTFYDIKKRILYRTVGEGVPVEIGEQVAYIRFYDSLVYKDIYMIVKNEVPTTYVPYGEKLTCDDFEIITKGQHQLVNPWLGKNCVTYGDSITAQGNTGIEGYQRFVNNEIRFSNIYNRGVGGQSYIWNDGTFYANADGSYHSRDNLSSPPAGTTEHRGCYSSWDRITTMIPETIRETIDLIILMGGTNDHPSITSEDLTEIPKWSSDYDTDTDWVNADGFYNGGDYNVKTFVGGIASTIMKMQSWCPNAVIVLATPFCKYDTSINDLWLNNDSISLKEVSQTELDIAKRLSIPTIDVNSTCCVNAFNYSDFVSDGVHPSLEGQKRLARSVVSGLLHIYPIIRD